MTKVKLFVIKRDTLTKTYDIMRLVALRLDDNLKVYNQEYKTIKTLLSSNEEARKWLFNNRKELDQISFSNARSMPVSK